MAVCIHESRCLLTLSESTDCQLPKCGNKLFLKKEVNTLTEPEKKALLAAIKKGIDQGEYSKLANFHGAPLTMCNPLRSDGQPIRVDRGAVAMSCRQLPPLQHESVSSIVE